MIDEYVQDACNLINAALAAERDKADNLFKVARKHCVENQQLKKQLAAERERGERMAGDGSYFLAIRKVREQLAAEREKVQPLVDALYNVCSVYNLAEAQSAARAGLAKQP